MTSSRRVDWWFATRSSPAGGWSMVVVALLTYARVGGAQEPASDCLSCHGGGHKNVPATDPAPLRASAHGKLACQACHQGAERSPHEPDLPAVRCESCHADAGREYATSVHARAVSPGDPDEPRCTHCHGTHDVFPVADLRSPVARLKIDTTCIRCHGSEDIAGRHPRLPSPDFVRRYTQSVHGRGVHEKGLTVSATCTDCHGVHGVRAPIDPESTTNRDRVPTTCSKCHLGIFEDWQASAHGRAWKARRNDGPVCTDCHRSHEIAEPKGAPFRGGIALGCGGCHEDEALTFGDTFHGQATSLGFVVAANCADCHTPHRNLPKSDPASSVHPRNLQATCGACHPGANDNFTRFQPHFDAEDPKQSRVAHGIGVLMKWLLLVVFGGWGLHTLLWMQRSIVAIRRGEFPHEPDEKWIRRFDSTAVRTHLVVVVSFLGLVATGLPLMYHSTAWARALGALWGGVEVARYMHRVFAIVTFGYAVHHAGGIVLESIRARSVRWLVGPESLTPRWKDVVDLVDNVRWFLHLGPPPRYGRFTYFEKFDYLAVFWGVPVIGLSGLILWFPGFFSSFLPGITLNIAHLVHSEEALLAFGFIFTFHFFHSHMRPENFPMDMVVFVGSMPLARFRRERPEEYEARVAAGTLEQILVAPPDPALMRRARIFGAVSLGMGLLLVGAVFITYLRGIF